jgi:poly-gamma-glutamate synthesis protein (capsule biosynthesis protein)
VLTASDIAVANLEAPFTTSGHPFDKKYTFMVPPDFAPGLKSAGFDVLTLANNHILDYGPSGLFTTMRVLDTLGIAYCGAGRDRVQAEEPVVCCVEGRKIGFLAFSMTYPSEFWAGSDRAGTAYPDLERMKKTITALKDTVDLVVVSYHWGGELKTTPKAYQKRFACNAVDAGADLVLGHHPHVLQGLQRYKNRLIAYSLGNFVFGTYSSNTGVSAILKVYFNDRGFLLAEIIPVSVNNYEIEFQPRLLHGERRREVLQMLNRISMPLNNGTGIVRPSGLIGPEMTPIQNK